MRIHSLVLLSFATSILGYTIITPNASKGWTNSGPQAATWQWGGNDAANFTVVLTNNDTSFYGDQVLSALVNGSSLSTTFNPPGQGWPVGDGFSLRFVKDVNNLNVILAKSDNFSIELPPQNSSSSMMSTPSPTLLNPTPSIFATPTTTDDGSQESNHARPRNDVHTALTSMFGLVGLVLFRSLV